MSWSVNIGPVTREKFAHALSEASIEDQVRAMTYEMRQAQLDQFMVARSMAKQMGVILAGPKLSAKLEGHAVISGEATPPGSEAARLNVEVHQVRFAGE